ncbi:MAG TPA: hypothetical protein VGN96_02770 [Roseococcus sp.]|nr:hypothetical protein [Roseococcus sp.]
MAAALPLLVACVADSSREDAAAMALLDSQRASLAALGQPMPSQAPAATPGRGPGAVRELLGASPASVIGRLGAPRLRRREGDAEVWLYSAGGCQLDLMFYSSPQGLRVTHAQARASGVGQRTEAACLRDITSQGVGQGQRAALPGP